MDTPPEHHEDVEVHGDANRSSPTPTVAERVHRSWSRLVATIVAALMVAAGIGGYEFEQGRQSSSAPMRAASATAQPTTSSTSLPSASDSTSTSSKTLAQIEAAVDPALVDITATVGNSGTAKGTGMVISSNGEILTNNHVIASATRITVQIDGSGPSYQANLVGYDTTHDIAVLQIPDVVGLKTIQTASASTLSIGDAVVAIGNALGQGGTPAAAQGTVTNLKQTITASDESGLSAETLNGLIEISAAVEPGDSGGATVDSAGRVIGMTTAASSGGFQPMSSPSTTTAYAIPIETALSIAGQIETGTDTATVHIGEHGLLGVEVRTAVNGAAEVAAVQSGSAAAQSGITSGAVITSINGHTIASVSDLNQTMASTHLGEKITISWQDSTGATHDATATLTTGAA